MDYTKDMREAALRLFQDNRIDIFIGYKGTEKATEPCLIRKQEDVLQLVFNDRSEYNLANFLATEHTRGKKVGVVLKGCDSRSLNMLITEGQVKRENLYVIGICCDGIKNTDGTMQARCAECITPDALVFDEQLGRQHDKKQYTPSADVIELAEKSIEQRGAIFTEIFENCIRCNACRNSCPMCYCEKCVIDQESSGYFNVANTVPNAGMALLTWAMHLAGRCVDCRNCERACPQNLPLHLLHKQNEKIIYENFQQHLAGVTENDRGALYKYTLEDPDDFIM